MADKSKAPKDSGLKYDAESISRIALKVKAEGFVPKGDLATEFGADKITQAIAILYRDFRLFREVRRPWKDGQDVLGYEWANEKLSQSAAKKVPAELGFIVSLASNTQRKYGDFEEIITKFRWIAPILGSVPIKDEHGDPTNVFERDSLGHILILRYHQRAMASMALPMIGKEAAAARHIGWAFIRLPSSTPVKIVEHGIVEQGRAGGKGLRRSECVADGLEAQFDALIPTSVLAFDEHLRMLRTAGKRVGLSPGRSAGFGDFEVLGAE